MVAAQLAQSRSQTAASSSTLTRPSTASAGLNQLSVASLQSFAMPPANGNGVRGKGAYHNGVPLPRPVPAIPLPYLRRNNKAGTAKQQQQQQQPQEHSQSQSLAPSTATAWQPDTRDQATRTPKVTPKDPESAQSTTESAAGDTSANGIPKTEDVSAQEVVDGRANGTGKHVCPQHNIQLGHLHPTLSNHNRPQPRAPSIFKLPSQTPSLQATVRLPIQTDRQPRHHSPNLRTRIQATR